MSDSVNDNYKDMYLPTTSGSESKTPEGTNWTIFANVRKHADTSQQTEALLKVSMFLGVSRCIPLAPSTTINNACQGPENGQIQVSKKNALLSVNGRLHSYDEDPDSDNGSSSLLEIPEIQVPLLEPVIGVVQVTGHDLDLEFLKSSQPICGQASFQEYMKSSQPICGLANECARNPTLVDGQASFQESTKNQGAVRGQEIGNVRQDNSKLPPLLPRRTDGHMNVVIRNGISLRSSEETGEANDHDVKDEMA